MIRETDFELGLPRKSRLCSVAAAVVGGAVVGSVISGSMQSDAAESAANTQANAANNASQMQMNMFNKTQANLQPYMDAGTSTLPTLMNMLGIPFSRGGTPGTGTSGTSGFDTQTMAPPGMAPNDMTGSLLKKFNPTMGDLENTPGYKFSLDQGLKATQNGFAARGLGSSGAAMKGAAGFAEGLAGTTFQQQFNNYMSQNAQIYNELTGITNMGQNSAAGVGQQGTAAAANAGSFASAAGAASAAGTIGSANALAGGISNATNAGMNGFMMNKMGMFGSPGAAPNYFAGTNNGTIDWNPIVAGGE